MSGAPQLLRPAIWSSGAHTRRPSRGSRLEGDLWLSRTAIDGVRESCGWGAAPGPGHCVGPC